MKLLSYLFLMICFFGIFTSNALSQEANQDILIQVKTPFYPVENFNHEIKFVIINNGNDTFNGTLNNKISSDNIRWIELEDDITVLPHNSSTVTRSFKAAYTGEYWIMGNLRDINDHNIMSVENPLNVHPITDAVAIGGFMIAVLAYIFKK